MKIWLPLVIVAVLPLGLAHAQTAEPNGAAMQNLTPAQQARREKVQGERQTCRTEAQGQGVKPDGMRAAVMACMAKVDPMAAKRMGCAQQAHAQNLTGDAMKSAMRSCMTGAG